MLCSGGDNVPLNQDIHSALGKRLPEIHSTSLLHSVTDSLLSIHYLFFTCSTNDPSSAPRKNEGWLLQRHWIH